ncbi:DNA repair exonuclease [Coemansia reversa NRRL 1564]|uniref:Double-strand break repair protein n=1 Tax=Coemansia reversa (strain ATCC 12441 / NRRL 1564) TaxID=763665 RepID=A0A2G5B386_COERN|nr:DNA repair exonuclease [Coemansia reversa NRRL 1564]|eukprot:PIA13483.1 DNA repair exonuclease [Coemansia reversa NRRL 1564]
MTVGDKDTLKILVATDNHLGYLERDPIRGQDSFDAFAEILQLARKHKVDMVLLGGDLFHDNKPSRKCLHQTMAMLRQNCMGEDPVAIEYLSDPAVDFGSQFPQINYEDPNMNVSLPVFSIHGNHDDPSGDGNLSAMDMLGVSGLVNYFGRQTEVDNIRVSPVLLRKGNTHLALFGLGNVRDERLHRTIARKHMVMCQPAEDTEKWFNLMVLHQNRVAHGPKNHIPEHFLDGFLDLVIWGHEHQCQVDPEYNHQKAFYVSQPGSSVATALSSGEAVAKHVALVCISQRNFKLEKIRLKNVRPFIIEDVVLSTVPSLSPQSSENEIVDFLRRKVEAMIEQLEDGCPDVLPALGAQPKPLIRVRVEYSGGFESFHPQRFGLLFSDRVANPRDIVYFYRKARASSATSQRTGSTRTQDTQDSRISVPAPVDAVHVESLISEFLDDSSMQMLVDLELAEAIRLFVQKGDNEAISQSLKSTIADTQKRILKENADLKENTLESQIAHTRSQRRQAAEANGHGAVDHVLDDQLSAVTLTTKRSAINQSDRQAIKAFEQVASVAGSPFNNTPEDANDGSGIYNSSDEGDSQGDDELRAAGENPGISKRGGKTSRAVSTRGRVIAPKTKRVQASLAKKNAPVVEEIPETDDEQDVMSIASDDSNSSDSSDSIPTVSKTTRGRGRGRGNARKPTNTASNRSTQRITLRASGAHFSHSAWFGEVISVY